MKHKRSKKYRKTMDWFRIHFNIKPPYKVRADGATAYHFHRISAHVLGVLTPNCMISQVILDGTFIKVGRGLLADYRCFY
jgi:hypothetical protein